MVARIVAITVALMLTAPWAAAGSAVACQATGGKPLLDESFKIPDPGWGPPDDAATFTSGGLVLKPSVNGSAWRWNPNYTIDGHDLCVTVTNPAQPPGKSDIGDVGIWFWSRNQQNFYTATISLDGTTAVDRLVNGVWQTIVPPTPSGAVHTGPGAVNEVEVTVNGDTGTFYVNGAKVADFKGQAPPNGGPPGVYAESGAAAVTWTFPRVQLY